MSPNKCSLCPRTVHTVGEGWGGGAGGSVLLPPPRCGGGLGRGNWQLSTQFRQKPPSRFPPCPPRKHGQIGKSLSPSLARSARAVLARPAPSWRGTLSSFDRVPWASGLDVAAGWQHWAVVIVTHCPHHEIKFLPCFSTTSQALVFTFLPISVSPSAFRFSC